MTLNINIDAKVYTKLPTDGTSLRLVAKRWAVFAFNCFQLLSTYPLQFVIVVILAIIIARHHIADFNRVVVPAFEQSEGRNRPLFNESLSHYIWPLKENEMWFLQCQDSIIISQKPSNFTFWNAIPDGIFGKYDSIRDYASMAPRNPEFPRTILIATSKLRLTAVPIVALMKSWPTTGGISYYMADNDMRISSRITMCPFPYVHLFTGCWIENCKKIVNFIYEGRKPK